MNVYLENAECIRHTLFKLLRRVNEAFCSHEQMRELMFGRLKFGTRLQLTNVVAQSRKVNALNRECIVADVERNDGRVGENARNFSPILSDRDVYLEKSSAASSK